MLLKIGHRYCRIDFCRGWENRCQHSLTAGSAIPASLSGYLRNSDLVELVEEPDDHSPLAHRQIKIAVAACPNSCSLPQIKAIGMIAQLRPKVINQNCSRCGLCVRICREKAMKKTDGFPEWIEKKCVGCGTCIKQCPQHAIVSHPLRMNILIGGRMGRHPRWAEELCTVTEQDFLPVLEKLVRSIQTCLGGSRSFADLIEENGLMQVKEQILCMK